jgi:hypothetical protein
MGRAPWLLSVSRVHSPRRTSFLNVEVLHSVASGRLAAPDPGAPLTSISNVSNYVNSRHGLRARLKSGPSGGWERDILLFWYQNGPKRLRR